MIRKRIKIEIRVRRHIQSFTRAFKTYHRKKTGAHLFPFLSLSPDGTEMVKHKKRSVYDFNWITQLKGGYAYGYGLKSSFAMRELPESVFFLQCECASVRDFVDVCQSVDESVCRLCVAFALKFIYLTRNNTV